MEYLNIATLVGLIVVVILASLTLHKVYKKSNEDFLYYRQSSMSETDDKTNRCGITWLERSPNVAKDVCLSLSGFHDDKSGMCYTSHSMCIDGDKAKCDAYYAGVKRKVGSNPNIKTRIDYFYPS